MATMPSRHHTLTDALASVLPQVHRLYVYLDGHADVPEAIKGEAKIVPIPAKFAPGLRANGKFLPLDLHGGDFLFAGFDDDIVYPPRYTAGLANSLESYDGNAVVGYHGVLLAEPFVRYRDGRTVFHFASRLAATRPVDVLGTGTMMFSTAKFRPDFRSWKQVNMMDLNIAVEAEMQNKPLVCLGRKQGFLRALDDDQPDSCYSLLLRDDSEQSRLARQLIGIRVERAISALRTGRSPAHL
jgi:hypothetical protein